MPPKKYIKSDKYNIRTTQKRDLKEATKRAKRLQAERDYINREKTLEMMRMNEKRKKRFAKLSEIERNKNKFLAESELQLRNPHVPPPLIAHAINVTESQNNRLIDELAQSHTRRFPKNELEFNMKYGKREGKHTYTSGLPFKPMTADEWYGIKPKTRKKYAGGFKNKIDPATGLPKQRSLWKRASRTCNVQ